MDQTTPSWHCFTQYSCGPDSSGCINLFFSVANAWQAGCVCGYVIKLKGKGAVGGNPKNLQSRPANLYRRIIDLPQWIFERQIEHGRSYREADAKVARYERSPLRTLSPGKMRLAALTKKMNSVLERGPAFKLDDGAICMNKSLMLWMRTSWLCIWLSLAFWKGERRISKHFYRKLFIFHIKYFIM